MRHSLFLRNDSAGAFVIVKLATEPEVLSHHRPKPPRLYSHVGEMTLANLEMLPGAVL